MIPVQAACQRGLPASTQLAVFDILIGARCNDRCLMHIKREILPVVVSWQPLLPFVRLWRFQRYRKGRAFNMRQVPMNRLSLLGDREERDRAPTGPAGQGEPLQSGVLSSPAEPLLSRAIARTLSVPPPDRARLFAQLISEIEAFMAAHPKERPWTCKMYDGTDGSAIFRGGVGHSLVIDLEGRLWRARSYEDFDTTYKFTDRSCEIDTLTPLYAQMREYGPR